jgi:hypothetical protein
MSKMWVAMTTITNTENKYAFFLGVKDMLKTETVTKNGCVLYKQYSIYIYIYIFDNVSRNTGMNLKGLSDEF